MRTWPRGRNADYVSRVLKSAQDGQWALVVRAIRAAADRVSMCICPTSLSSMQACSRQSRPVSSTVVLDL